MEKTKTLSRKKGKCSKLGSVMWEKERSATASIVAPKELRRIPDVTKNKCIIAEKQLLGLEN